MFRWYSGALPTLFSTFFVYNRNVYQYGTRQKDMFHVPQVKTDLGKASVRYKGAVLWNTVLKLGFSVDTSEAVFVKNLKRNLFGGSV